MLSFFNKSPFIIVAGVRAVNVDRYAGYAPGGFRNGTRIHIRHPETAADDNE